MAQASHTRDTTEVRLIAAVIRSKGTPSEPAERRRVGISLRQVRERLAPADFESWVTEDAGLQSDHAWECMEMAAGSVDALRPAELG